MISKEKRTLLFFYLLAFYIFCQIVWWGYSLMKLHSDIALNDDDNLSRMYMVLGEGIVFLIIFLFGTWKIQRNLRRDFQHARTEKTFLLSVTHELKTPVAILRLMLETLRKKELDRTKQNEIITGALDETERLQNLTENILFVTRLNQGKPSLYSENLNFSELVDTTVERFQEQSAHRLQKTIEPVVNFTGDRQTLQILLSNLIDNALKYSSPEGLVIITLKTENGRIHLSVADNGPGIPESERKKVLDKFYRIGNEETRKHRGTGLGLFIVARITELHRGKIQIRNNQPIGTIVHVTLPGQV